MKKIMYVGYYDCDKNKEQNRNYILAATNKMTYICSAINRAGLDVEIVSASGTKSNASFSGKQIEIMPNTKLTLFPTRGRSTNKIVRVTHRWLLNYHLFWYLLKNTKADEPILVYHSLGYANIIKILKKIKKFRLVLEVEEFYSDVTGKQSDLKKEMKLFNMADAYIFPTELLDEKLNKENHKPSVIIYGTYQIERDRHKTNKVRDVEEKIHLLYAGTFDPRKGGALSAVNAARYLSSKYHLHIIGFGSEKDKEELEETISEVTKKSNTIITMDGLLGGEDYIKFVQKCHIGLSSQNPNAAFNETSFPSKILSYLANGLRVVSVKIKVLERSKISELPFYYYENTPEAIADAIKKIDLNEAYDSRKKIKELDEKFVKEIGYLLK